MQDDHSMRNLYKIMHYLFSGRASVRDLILMLEMCLSSFVLKWENNYVTQSHYW